MGPVMLRFYLLPAEHRIVVTPAAVKAATGHYYVRVYGGDTRAKVSDGARPPSSVPCHTPRLSLHSPSPAPRLGFFTLRPNHAQARICSVASPRSL